MLPGPAARTTMRPQCWPGGGPKLASLLICTLPETSIVAAASASSSALCESASSQKTYAPPVSVSLAAVWSDTRPYVPGARSQRPFPGVVSAPRAQSRPATASTSFARLQVGNGVGNPQAAARSPASTTHWPDATLQLAVPAPSAS